MKHRRKRYAKLGYQRITCKEVEYRKIIRQEGVIEASAIRFAKKRLQGKCRYMKRKNYRSVIRNKISRWSGIKYRVHLPERKFCQHFVGNGATYMRSADEEKRILMRPPGVVIKTRNLSKIAGTSVTARPPGKKRIQNMSPKFWTFF